jgi:RND family efflux transporter MFP subunit
MIDSSLDQLKSSQKMADGADALTKIQSEYDVERMKLDAGKAAVISAIEGEKARLKVGVSEGNLQQVRASISAHEVGNGADQARVTQRKIKAERDLEQVTGYLGMMKITAPADGVVALLPNFRSRGSYGTAQPPFKEGDNVWAAAPIAEIPDLATLYVELTLEEVERGKVQLGQAVRVRVDAIPDREFRGALEFISPIGALVYRGGSTPEKTFPARVALKEQDARLQPGMSVSADVITEHVPQVLLAPARATFEKNGAPAVYVMKGNQFEVRQVQVGRRNEDEIIVNGGLAEGEMVTLEDPAETARRARKKG